MNDATVKFGFDGADLKIGLAEAERRIKRAASNMDGAIRTVADAYQNEQAKAKQAQAVNPWASNTAAAKQYAQIVETRVVSSINQAAAAQQAAADKATRSKFLGNSMGSEFDTNSMLAREAQRSRNAGGAAAAGGGRRNGNYQLGQVALQFQDIAVQAQMGTRASIILAQQGSQLASAFGPAGMIAGGVLAIGGAFYTMGERATEAFNNVMASSREFQKNSALLIQSTNAENLASHLSQVRAQIIAIQAEQKNLNTFFGDLAARIDGGDPGAMNAQLENEMAAQAEIYSQSVDRALVNSKKQTEITQLLAEGRKDEADALQRSMELGNELARIDAMRIQEWAKDRLKADAVTRSEASVSGQDSAVAREEVLRIEEKLSAERLRQLDPVERLLELSNQQEAALAKMAEQGGMFFEQSKEGLEAWSKALKESGDIETLAKAMQIMEESTELQNQMAEAEREITMQRDQRDAEADKKREQDKAEQSKLQEQAAKEWETLSLQEQGKRNIREEIMLLEAKAAGQTDLVNRMERELRIREKTKEIEAQTGINSAQARKSAEQIIGLEDAADQQAAASARMPRRMMGGIDEGPISLRGGFGRGRMMGAPDAGPISSRSARSTTNPDLSRAATPASGGDVGAKLDKTNNLLERVFFAAS